MDRESLTAYTSREADAIDSAMIELGVRACINGVAVAGGSYVLYGLTLGKGTQLGQLTAILPDVSQRVAAYRQRPTRLRLREYPLALEADHPDPLPLSWRSARLAHQTPHTVLVGAEFSKGRVDVRLALDDAVHTLVAGTTGSGKSTVLRAMITSLCWSTSPADLAVYLVDLKCEDLVPYRDLPHVLSFGGTDRSASEIVAQVESILTRRTENGVSKAAQRIVLVIDELAQLPDDAKQRLGRILAVGRSKRIHVVAATQHPTKSLIGEKHCYGARLVGRVTDAASSALCCGRPGVGAEMLPGKGAFMLVDASGTRRIQAYLFGDDTAPSLVAAISDIWQNVTQQNPDGYSGTGAEPVSEQRFAPKTAGFMTEPVLSLVPAPAPEPLFPLPMRPATAVEAQRIREMAGRMSKNDLVRLVYGTKNGRTFGWVTSALSMKGQ